MFGLKDVQQVIDDLFLEEICSEVTDCINNLTGGELEGVFEDEVDFVTCDDIEDITVISYDVTEFDSQTEISGDIEVKAELRGYLHWEGDDIDVGAVQKCVSVSFLVYKNGDNYEDFEIIDISV